MTITQKRAFKENLKVFGVIANFVIVAAVFWNQAQWQGKVDLKIEKFEEHITDFNDHEKNKELHMDYQTKTKLFVPRSEMKIQNKAIMDILVEIRKDIKNLEKND